MRRHYADWMDRKSNARRVSVSFRELNRGSHVDGGYALMGVESRAKAFPSGSSSARAVFALAMAGVALGGCAQPPRTAAYHGKEYFSVAKYGPASPRVVEDGQPVPRGGGQYLVGHPYTIAGHTYYPGENSSYTAVGMASWYGDAFHGRRTANGEVYDMRSLTAAHPTMPLPSYARVTNLANGYSVIVRVNDRGPYHGGRVMDVSSRAADVLDFKAHGHRQDQGRVCRARAARRLRRQRIAREPAHRRFARHSRRHGAGGGDGGRRRRAPPRPRSSIRLRPRRRQRRAPASVRARGSAGLAAPSRSPAPMRPKPPAAAHRPSACAARASVRPRPDPLFRRRPWRRRQAAASAGAAVVERSRALFRARGPAQGRPVRATAEAGADAGAGSERRLSPDP